MANEPEPENCSSDDGKPRKSPFFDKTDQNYGYVGRKS